MFSCVIRPQHSLICKLRVLLKLMLPGFEESSLPVYSRAMALYPPQPRWVPFCRGVRDSLPPWTGCQSRKVAWAVKNYLSFSPYIGTVHNSSFSGYNWTYQNPAQVGASNPFIVWLLCGVNGSCTDLSPLSMVAGGAWDNARFYWNGSGMFESSIFQFAGGRNVSFQATPVCMWPPFVFIVYKGSYEDSIIICSSNNCIYSMC